MSKEKRTIDKILREHLSTINMGKNTERNIDITERYYGFNGNDNSGMSMQDAGSEYSLTRESVRQITCRTVQYLKDTFIVPEELKAAISIIAKNLPSTGNNLKNILVSEGLLSEGFKIECVLNIISIMELKTPYSEVVKYYNDKLIISDESQDISQKIESSAISHISHNGAASVSELSKMVPFGNKEFKRNFVISLFLTMDESRFTEDNEWVFFHNRGRNRLINRIKLIFSEIKETNIDYIQEGIERNWRKNEKKDKTIVLDKDVILFIISTIEGLTIHEDGRVTSAKRIKIDTPLKRFEKGIFDMISKSKTGFCKEKELEDALVKKPTDKWAFSVALNYSPLLRKDIDHEKSKEAKKEIRVRGEYKKIGLSY